MSRPTTYAAAITVAAFALTYIAPGATHVSRLLLHGWAHLFGTAVTILACIAVFGLLLTLVASQIPRDRRWPWSERNQYAAPEDVVAWRQRTWPE